MMWEPFDYGPALEYIIPDAEPAENYRPGGLHPIEIGQFIGPDSRFEVCQKSAYDDNYTEWLVRDHVQNDWKLVRTFLAEDSDEEHGELVIKRILSEGQKESLQDNHIVLPSEHFWVEGPNGRHLCIVYPVLGPKAPPEGINREKPDELIDLCFQIAKAVAVLHSKGICHGGEYSIRTHARRMIAYTQAELQQKNIRMLVDKNKVEDKIKNAQDLRKYMRKPYTWPLIPFKKEDRCHGPRKIVEPGSLIQVEAIARTKKIGIICTDRWYRPVSFLRTSYGMHKSRFPLRLHPAAEVRGGEGHTGFPSDIWALACLFGEIRTHMNFIRSPQYYGTPIEKEEIDRYLSSEAGIPRSFYTFMTGTEWEESSDSDVSDTTGDSLSGPFGDPSDLQDGKSSPSSNDSSQTPEQNEGQDNVTRGKEPQPVVSNAATETEKKRKNTDSQQIDGNGSVSKRQSSSEPNTAHLEVSTLPKESAEVPQVHDDERPRADSPVEEREKEIEGIAEATPKSPSTVEKVADASASATSPSTVETAQEKEYRTDRLPPEKITHRGFEYKMPEDEASLLGDLLEKMFAPKPEDRITIEEVLKHEWFGDRRASLAPPPSPAR